MLFRDMDGIHTKVLSSFDHAVKCFLVGQIEHRHHGEVNEGERSQPFLIGDFELASAMVFDLGVYLCVWGALAGYALALLEVGSQPSAEDR